MEHYLVEASTGRYLGTHVGYQRPDELVVDRNGAVVLVDGKPVVKTTFPYEPPPLLSKFGVVEVPFPPTNGHDVWDGQKYVLFVEIKKPDLDALVQALLAKGVITDTDLKEKTK